MSDAEQSQEVENNVEQQEVDYKALYEKTQHELESLAAHKEKLLDEVKSAKAKKREADLKELEARRLQEERDAKNGEFEKLFKQRDKEYQQALEQMNKMKESYKREKIEVTAMNIANDLADGPNAKLLSKFIGDSLNNLADENGSLSDDVLNSVKQEFKTNETYQALLRKSKAAGGGAPGNMRGAQEDAKVLTRSKFMNLSAEQQMEFIKNSGQIVNE